MPYSYKATFQDGTSITRKSARAYTHAWRVTTANGTDTGFAASAELARRAAQANLNGRTGRQDLNSCTSRSSKSTGHLRYKMNRLREKGGQAAWEAEVRQREAAATLEIAVAMLGEG